MPKKESSKNYKSSKEKIRAETATVKGTITLHQREILKNFIGIIGSNEQDVVGKILTLWMYNEGYLKKDK